MKTQLRLSYLLALVTLMGGGLAQADSDHTGYQRDRYLDHKGDRIERHLERQGERTDGRFDRRGDAVDARLSWHIIVGPLALAGGDGQGKVQAIISGLRAARYGQEKQ